VAKREFDHDRATRRPKSSTQMSTIARPKASRFSGERPRLEQIGYECCK
jgi:hypothetical protein